MRVILALGVAMALAWYIWGSPAETKKWFDGAATPVSAIRDKLIAETVFSEVYPDQASEKTEDNEVTIDLPSTESSVSYIDMNGSEGQALNVSEAVTYIPVQINAGLESAEKHDESTGLMETADALSSGSEYRLADPKTVQQADLKRGWWVLEKKIVALRRGEG